MCLQCQDRSLRECDPLEEVVGVANVYEIGKVLVGDDHSGTGLRRAQRQNAGP